jgi:hypothetical protein
MSAPVRRSPAAQPGPGGRKWRSKPWLWLAVILGGSLVVLFFQSFQPDRILFDNDFTFGQMKAAANHLPGALTGRWYGGWVGREGVAEAPTVSAILMMVLSPEIFLKIYAPFTLFFAGFCAWVFFRQLQFNPAVCLLGGVAAGLNMHFFSNACWGLGSWNMAAGMIFLALAVLCSRSIPQIWAKGILAGLAVGMNLMEGNDIGAILCVYVGLFIVWQIFTAETPGVGKVLTALCTEALVIFFSALIAAHSISSLVDTQVVGVVGTSQDEETKEKRWNPATRWSLPKLETLRVVIPGLFGYRMTGRITVPDKSSAYWGTVGQDPRISDIKGDNAGQRAKAVESFNLPAQQREELESSDRQTRANAITALMNRSATTARYSGSGEYAGVLVSLLAFFALVNSWRGTRAPYSRGERRAVWFWGGAALFSLLAAWGRHAFFYRLLYQLPYVSTIRNPIKFMHPFHIAWLILAAYGMEALWRRYLQTAARRTELLPLHLQGWWSKASGFEKNWAVASLALVGASLVALFFFSNWEPHLAAYLKQEGFSADRAVKIAGFSVVEARWFAVWLLVSAGVIVGVISGAWNGPQARLAWIYLGVIIILDLARSDAPWVHYFNYKQEYAGNSVVDFLKDKPYEHRVTGRLSPKGVGSGIGSLMGKLYDYWQQNDFPYHSIQTLDFAQWPRMPLLDASYMKNFALKGDDLSQCDLWPSKRLWELTNTRYILNAASVAPLLNKQADASHSFRVRTFLNVVRKQGLTAIEDFGDYTAVPDGQGAYALIEFTDPLPRAKLYSHWQSPTNDDATLETLASHEFDPEHTVLVARDTPVGQPPGDPNLDPGTVTITDYQPKHVKLQANATTPAVLLLNDRITPAWKVWIDHKAAPLLRCNYLMRGVFLTPGGHTVEFRFQPPLTALHLSFCAWGVGILTAGYLIYSRAPAPTPAPAPIPPATPNPPEKASPARQPETVVRAKQKRKR